MTPLWIRRRIAAFAMLCTQAVFVVGFACAQPTNYQGLWWNWPPESESGWGINLAHQGDTLFATWFTYDTAGDGWWLSMTAIKTADRTYAGTLIETKGPAFSALPFDPNKVTRTAVGNGTLTFSDADNGVLSYTVKGFQQKKIITRQVWAAVPTCTYGTQPNFAVATNYQDLWWAPNGAESGWGINVTHQGDNIFATWFTYDTDGTPLWLSVTASKVAARVYSGDLIRTRGPAFSAVPFNPALVTRTVVGRATFTFADGNAAAFTYTVGDVTQTKTIVRQRFSPPAGTVCAVGTFGDVTVDKTSLALMRGAKETVTVTATDPSGNPVSWDVRSDNPGIATALRLGSSTIEVTGQALGRSQVNLVTASGTQRSVPVRVYDPMVLDVGEILIKYVDNFACRWSDAHAGAAIHASFYHPIRDEGWQALGSLGDSTTYECGSVNKKRWMMVVRANPDGAVPGNLPPLKPPVGFEKEWDDAGTGGDVMFGAFWTPICDAGYVAMGTVVTGGWTTAGRNPPPLTDATCVRRDLTIPGRAASTIWNDKGTGGDVRYQGSFVSEAPANFSYETTAAYLKTGTLVTQGDRRSCSGEGCWSAPSAHSVMNVLKVYLPMLIDTTRTATLPTLRSYDSPPAVTEPVMAKAMLVPFTAVESAEHWNTRGLDWMVNNSPFVRIERVLRYGLEFWTNNGSSVAQNHSKTFTKGISTTDSESFSHTAGVSITAGGGVEFLGTGGKVSATVSYQFGYQSQHSVGAFSEESTTITINVPAHKAAAVWLERSEIQVKVHNPTTYLLELVRSIPMNDSFNVYNGEYPN